MKAGEIGKKQISQRREKWEKCQSLWEKEGSQRRREKVASISLSLSSTMTLTRQGSSLLVEDIKDRVEPLNLNSRSTA